MTTNRCINFIEDIEREAEHKRRIDRVTRSAAGLEGKVRASAAAMATFSGYGSATASRLQGVANLFSLIGVKAGIAVGAIAGAAAGLSAASGVQNWACAWTSRAAPCRWRCPSPR